LSTQLDCFNDFVAFVPQLIDVAHHHHTVQYGYAEHRDESHGSGHREVKPRHKQRDNATSNRKGHIHEDQRRIAQATECRKEKQENKRQGNGHNDRQPRHGPFLVLKLTAELHEIPRRHVHLLLDPLAQILNNTAHIATTYVHLHVLSPTGIGARNFLGASVHFNIGHP